MTSGPPVVDLAAELPLPPSSIPTWGKALWWLARTVAYGSAFHLFEYGEEIQPSPLDAGGLDPSEWRRVQIVWKNLATDLRADDQICTVDIVNTTGGRFDPTWTTGDYANTDTAIAAFVTAIAGGTVSWLQAYELRYYAMKYNDYDYKVPIPNTDPVQYRYPAFADSGPPQYVKTLSTTGSGGTAGAAQTAVSITELTPVRRNWGRMYAPTPGSGVFGSYGHIGPATVDAYADAYAIMGGNLQFNGFYPVVPTTYANKERTRVLQNVTGVQVDDVPDVIRRRRSFNATYKKSFV